MKTALLVCDHLPEKLTAVHGNYIHMFNSILDIPLDPFYVIDHNFPDPDDYDAYVITGSKYSVYDSFGWISMLKEFTSMAFDKGKKTIGICFGHQLIAEALGGKVERSRNGFLIGIHDFRILQKEKWMDPPVSNYKTLMLCQDQVVKLPENSIVLSGSSHCPVGMFSVDKHFLGIQGHPEFTKEYNRDVFESRIEKIGIEKIEVARASLHNDPDTSLLKSYMMSFMKRDDIE